MALKTFATLGFGLLLCGCGGALPEPRITEVAPAEVNAAALSPITITLDAVLPTNVDFGTGEATSDSTVSVFVNFTEIGTTRIDAAGMVRALVPPNLDAGPYDVSVQLSDGRRARAPAALTVVR